MKCPHLILLKHEEKKQPEIEQSRSHVDRMAVLARERIIEHIIPIPIPLFLFS